MEVKKLAKIAITTDSNSGITQNEAKQLGVSVIPMPFIINNETYFEDINLTQEEFYGKLEGDDDISTTQPSPEQVINAWDEALKNNDYVIHIPMSSGLSGSCATALMLSQEEDYKDKVFVVDNQRISVTQRQAVYDALAMVEKGMEPQAIYDKLMEMKLEASIYIMLDTLKYLKKGGRITPAAAALGTILKLKPVLQIQGEKLDSFSKARTVNLAKKVMTEAIKNDIITRFGGDASKVVIGFAYTKDIEPVLELKEEIIKDIPDCQVETMFVDPLSLSVSCHIGPGAIGIGVMKKLDV